MTGAIQTTHAAELVCREASSDEQLVALWLGTYRSPSTIRAYRAAAASLRAFGLTALREIRLVDLQAYSASLTGTASTQSSRLSAVKSLIGFAHRLGYVRFDTAAPLRLPAIKDALAERIVTEEQVLRMLGMERRPRDAALLRLLYVSGMRIAEACSLRWRDLRPRESGGGQFAVMGKGGRTRTILLTAAIWHRLMELRGAAGDDAPLFQSRKGAALQPSQVHVIVKRAARRAQMPAGFSAHWFRHAHASHALDRGCPVHVLQTTLGHASLTTTTRYTHAKPGDSSARYLAA